MMTSERLREILSGFAARRVAVVGDYFLDRYLEFDPRLAEASLETGKRANQVVNIRHSPGAAGNVVANLAALGAGEIIPIGFVGDDGEGYELCQDLRRLGCNSDLLVRTPERHTPTYLKPRNLRFPGLEGEQERYDTKNRNPLPEEVAEQIMTALAEVSSRVDAVIVVDQVDEEECGAIASPVRERLCELTQVRPDVLFWADSRKRIGLFRNMLLKPNQDEAIDAAFPGYRGFVDADRINKAGRTLENRAGKPVYVTLAQRGILLFSGGGWREIPAVRDNSPIDPTGAGDSVSAAAVLALSSGATHEEAAYLAIQAAAVTARKLGETGTATQRELTSLFSRIHGA